MARTAYGVLLAAGLVLALATAANAQVPSLTTVPSAGGEVTILADHIEQIGAENLLIATGDVELTRGPTRLLADRIEVNRDTGDAVAQGRVIFYDGEDRFTANRIDYNLNTGTGVVYDANAQAPPYYRLSGERMERVGDSIYQVRRGVFTSCDDVPPTWSFRANSAHADMNSLITGTNGSFWVKSLPILPWLPFFALPTRRERQTGFLFPVFGENSRKGDYIQLPFYWAISDSQDATVTFDAYSKKGVGGSLDYRYIFSGGHRGEISGFFMKETEVKPTAVPGAGGTTTEAAGATRGWYGWKEAFTLLPGVSFTADINGVSDDLVLHDYSDALLQRSLQQVQSNVFITKSWSSVNLVSNFFWYQDLTTERPVELDRLPEIRLDAARQPVPGVPGRHLLWEFQGLADRFVRVIGSDGDRVDLHPRLSAPITPAGLFTITPFVGTRVTGYDRSDTGFRIGKDGVLVETTNNDPSLRRIIELGTDFEARASRVYFLGGLGGIDAILHSIEPRVNYSWSGMSGEKKLPQFTDIDALAPQNIATYSLTNRVLARTRVPEGVEPYRWEAVRFVVQQSYDFNALQRPFSDITGDLIVQPTPWLRWRSDAAYDIYDVGLRSSTTDVGLSLPWLLATVGTRLTRELVTKPNGRVVVEPSINFLQANVEAELSRYLVVRYTTNWDMITNTFVENRWGADIRFQCWAFTFSYVRRSEGTNELRFALSLLGMAAPLRFGTAVGTTAPPATPTP